jgi:hypothetical protein
VIGRHGGEGHDLGIAEEHAMDEGPTRAHVGCAKEENTLDLLEQFLLMGCRSGLRDCDGSLCQL